MKAELTYEYNDIEALIAADATRKLAPEAGRHWEAELKNYSNIVKVTLVDDPPQTKPPLPVPPLDPDGKNF